MTRTLGIIWGNTNIDMFSATGIFATSFAPTLQDFKGGAVWADSSLSDWRQPVQRARSNLNTTLVITVAGASMDAAMATLRGLINVLDDSMAYWTARDQPTFGYIYSKGESETATRYAIIYAYKFDQLPSVYGNSAEGGAGIGNVAAISALVGLSIALEHGPWSDSVPNVTTAIETSNPGTSATTNVVEIANKSITNKYPYVDIAAAQVVGDIPADLKLRMWNTGAGSVGQIIVGSRKLARGADFNAYINLADTGNDGDITVQLAGTLTFETDGAGLAPTGRYIAVSDVAAEPETFYITIGGDLSKQYLGTYHAYMRHSVVADGRGGYINIKIMVTLGGLTFYTQSVSVVGDAGGAITDIGTLKLIPDGFDVNADIGDITLTVQVSIGGSGGLYDLILIPSDSWICDIRSGIGEEKVPGGYMEIDAVGIPKFRKRAVSYESDGTIIDRWSMTTNGIPSLNVNTLQRLWFLANQTLVFSFIDTELSIQAFSHSNFLIYGGAI